MRRDTIANQKRQDKTEKMSCYQDFFHTLEPCEGMEGHLWQGEAGGTLTGIPPKVDLKKFTSMHKPRNGS